MARYAGPACRLCRREGKKLFLKGQRCTSDKCPIERGRPVPGEPGKTARPRVSGYAVHLREKQAVKRMYGIVEAQMKRYYEIASKSVGKTGEVLLQLLERRLDNVVFRAGFVPSRRAARQFVVHGHVLVNQRKVDRPSYQVKIGDVITLKEKSQKVPLVKETFEKSKEIPRWIEVDRANWTAKIIDLPRREDMPQDIREELIVEFYSK